MMSFTPFDHQMMQRALKLAHKAPYTTAPNPQVGCVITQGETIVGEGFHYRAGEPHAEVFALRQAGDNAQGATAYVTLEPCSHYGLTPPCAEALVKAKVAKVICAMQDPNPKVAGRGINILRQAGIEVEVGLLEADANAVNPAFISQMTRKRPFVQLKLAASLDGQTALSNGESKWITSAAARQDVQRYRAQSGAILSTSQTVIADNASLNVRWHDLPASVQEQYPEQELRQPARIILDRRNQLTPELALFQQSGEVLTVGEQGNIQIAADENGFDLTSLLESLSKQHNINHLWVEAGATLATSFIQAGLVDELILYLAPKLMGGDGRGVLAALGLEQMSQAIELEIKDTRMVGSDIRIIATLKQK
ncbi:bifunctional diaminohydroxyphosphoribosylaminopyrimidine deaminase/5-amino-6-(5-phosphoribosylamino)uracil reductase RibD [Vibrio sp. SCSIO 43136]|uniref:bifunctional diaminohydroxyphosphoribosylaminopyrimidine deaminase/5-amino-6-(5-phosphoribosylamino)uracil reductase RibD n=1 Tax=Vibrio sp. SCSIO 43136 TaxID=2819101 RepID=UPI00207663B4|nr:bifunctional diaminohydroxyphosphoribosylaminopyrimidine deaminase/5-amino-6-(5-phosphoribosylamino)uracil reductase RibD [Vibrio sp. SCSIO 43136]USD65863.1 bifunctional diaminohydroxyphosphoribosylaminopyrimidine deaminase/5-amino-6-(5-phosphoribosylamino)uracil reductase RibD [Vibrio sp. SCSIO 43136]